MYVKLLKTLRKLSASTADMCSGGCGSFWIANSVTSLVLGRRNRRYQEEASRRSEEFQLEMERNKNLMEDKRLQEEIAFKYSLLALARQYRQEELTEVFNNQLKTDQIKLFLNKYWPLEPSLASTFLKQEDHIKLNVILMPSQFFAKTKYDLIDVLDSDIFKELEYSIKRYDEPYIGDIVFHKDVARRADIMGGNAAVMNIHFLINQLPTLVIYPYCDNQRMNFHAAVWEAQAARPLMRFLFGVNFKPVDSTKANEDCCKKMKDLYHTAVAVIMGSVRDSYTLLTQGKEPTMPNWLNDSNHKEMKRIVQETAEIKQFIKQEYDSIVAALDSQKNQKLFDNDNIFFSEKDINNIKNKIMSNQLNL